MKLIQFIHQYWAYVVLVIVLAATLNAIAGSLSKKEFTERSLRISLFALVVTHIQILIGLVLYFMSPLGLKNISNSGMGEVMGNPTYRLFAVEHPLMMILAVILITIGYSRHKKKTTSAGMYRTLAVFYTLGLIFMLSRIPWSQWFS